jgi:hypothetical protein
MTIAPLPAAVTTSTGSGILYFAPNQDLELANPKSVDLLL